MHSPVAQTGARVWLYNFAMSLAHHNSVLTNVVTLSSISLSDSPDSSSDFSFPNAGPMLGMYWDSQRIERTVSGPHFWCYTCRLSDQNRCLWVEFLHCWVCAFYERSASGLASSCSVLFGLARTLQLHWQVMSGTDGSEPRAYHS